MLGESSMKFKNILLATTACGAILMNPSISSAERVFSGFYAGAQLGLAYQSEVMTFSGTIPSGKYGTKFDLSKAAFQYGLYGGWDHVIRKTWLLGAELGISRDGGKAKQAKKIRGNEFQTTLQRQYTVALKFKGGYVIGDTSLVYMNLGVLQSKFKMQLIDVGDTTDKESKGAFGFEVGAGYKYALNRRIGLRLEYGFQMYQNTESRNLADTPQTANITIKTSPKYHRIMAGVSVKLS